MDIILTDYIWRRVDPAVRAAVLAAIPRKAIIGRRADDILDDLIGLGEHKTAEIFGAAINYIIIYKDKFGVWPPVVIAFPD